MTTETKTIISVLVATLVLLGIFAFASKPKVDKSIDNKIQSVDTSGAWATGPENAPVTLVEFADFECPACGQAFPVLEQILKDYNGKIRFVHKHFPLYPSPHIHSMIAAEAAEAAGAQGKFWGMHDLLFKNQDQWARPDDSKWDPMPFYEQYAQTLGLNVTDFKKFVKDNKGKDAIERDQKEGQKLGVNATPTIYINGKGSSGVPTYDDLKKQIDAILNSSSPQPSPTKR